jgi:drug/metabolite transporter (DMT)-like permease
MVTWGVLRGERPPAVAWFGIAIALAGLVGLTVPGKSAPDPLGAAGMAIAGLAWGVYSLRGRVAGGDPLALTSASFSRSTLFAAALATLVLPAFGGHATLRGAVLAAASGAVASGIGYSVWYSALRFLTATRAAVLQLLVPVLAAGGAVALLGEHVSMRLVLASAAILGGVGLTILARSAPRATAPRSRHRGRARRRRRRS